MYLVTLHGSLEKNESLMLHSWRQKTTHFTDMCISVFEMLSASLSIVHRNRNTCRPVVRFCYMQRVQRQHDFKSPFSGKWLNLYWTIWTSYFRNIEVQVRIDSGPHSIRYCTTNTRLNIAAVMANDAASNGYFFILPCSAFIPAIFHENWCPICISVTIFFAIFQSQFDSLYLSLS